MCEGQIKLTYAVVGAMPALYTVHDVCNALFHYSVQQALLLLLLLLLLTLFMT